jgi:hypothetical protein
MGQEKEAILKEYLKNSKGQPNQLAKGLIFGSLVFIIPMILIVANGWWAPFGDDAAVGARWFVVAVIAMLLVYVSIIIDKLTRKF